MDKLDPRKAPPSPDQLISSGSGLPSIDDSKTTFPSVKPLSARADLSWERAILRKSSIFKSVVEKAQYIQDDQIEPSDKWLTVANAMTASRPLLALKVAKKLSNGEKGVWPYMLATGLSDVDGFVARKTNQIWPNSKRGSTKIGVSADKYADAVSLLIVCSATLKAPRISLPGKMAVGAILAAEGYKTGWAGLRAAQYAIKTGKLMDIPTQNEGKEAMIEKFLAVGSAICTGDTDDWRLRHSFGIVALAFAGVGVLRGENVRQSYQEISQELLGNNIAHT